MITQWADKQGRLFEAKLLESQGIQCFKVGCFNRALVELYRLNTRYSRRLRLCDRCYFEAIRFRGLKKK